MCIIYLYIDLCGYIILSKAKFQRILQSVERGAEGSMVKCGRKAISSSLAWSSAMSNNTVAMIHWRPWPTVMAMKLAKYYCGKQTDVGSEAVSIPFYRDTRVSSPEVPASTPPDPICILSGAGVQVYMRWIVLGIGHLVVLFLWVVTHDEWGFSVMVSPWSHGVTMESPSFGK